MTPTPIFAQTFLGPHPPGDLAVYLPFNLPWLVAPLVLGWRVHSGRLVGWSLAARR